MSEQLQIQCGPPDRTGRRLVIASISDLELRDRFDTDSEFHRRKFREKVIERFALGEEALNWIEGQITHRAGAEDARAESESLCSSQPVLVTMSDVEAREVDWLWPSRIAAGRITLLVGLPGCGKSFLTVDMASRISTGSPWPDGSACPRGSVIFISAEDDPHDTVRPRLDAHQADASRIHLLCMVKKVDDDGRETELMFSLSDVAALELALERVDDCRLIVVDPIGSFLGGRTDGHRDNEVRSVLTPISKLAEKYGPAMLVIAHRRKGKGTSADDLALGSRAFTGIARSVWHLSRDPDKAQRRLFLPGKSNIAPEQGGLAFSIGGEPASVCWEKDPVLLTADEALAREQKTGQRSTTLDEAIDWLRNQLQESAQPAKQVKDAAKADGIAARTLDRAKSKLGVVAGPEGFRGPWVWRLPADEPAEGSDTVRQDFPECAKEKTLAHSADSVAHCGESEQCARCGGSQFEEIHLPDSGKVRRDCAICGYTKDFPMWNGEATA